MNGKLVLELLKNLKVVRKTGQSDVERLKAYDLVVDVYADGYLDTEIKSPQRYIEDKLSKLYGTNVKFNRDRFRVALGDGSYAPLELNLYVLPKDLAVQVSIFLLEAECERK